MISPGFKPLIISILLFWFRFDYLSRQLLFVAAGLFSIIETFFFIILFYSCSGSGDDDTDIVPAEPLMDQYTKENDSIVEFMKTHFYNYEDFQDPDNRTKIKFDTIANENSNKTPLIEQVNKSTINVRISDGSFINHPIYTLVAREGIGESPSSVDSTYLSYEGLLLNKSIFDKSLTPIWFDLTSVVRGFREGMPILKPFPPKQ